MATKKKPTIKATPKVTVVVKEDSTPQWVERGDGHQCDWRPAGMLREGEKTEFCPICADTRTV